MIRSMTGYGRAQRVIGPRDITVEIKAVNHRYFELNARIPRAYLSLEDPIRGELRRSIVRGKIDLNLTVKREEGGDTSVCVDKELLSKYLSALRSAAEENGLRDDITASTVLRFPSVVTTDTAEEDAAEVWNDIRSVVEEAVAAFLSQRESEGQRLAEDIISKCGELTDLAARVEAHLPTLMSDYEARLRSRIEELLGERAVDEGRLLTEVAIMADKTAVDEELVRLRSHCTALKEMLENGISNGKKMDFIVQELNREVNTLTSKIGDLDVTRIAIEMKSLIEKIREQIQNIE
ncbi:MAG: YicC family protein [Clostridia bacterium]|nr:YicC family protein [Clostridia bacterium]